MMIEIFRMSYVLVGRSRPGRWVLLVFGAVVSSLLEIVGALLVLVLLGLVADPNGELSVPLLGDFRELFGDVEDQTVLLGLTLAMAVFFGLRVFFQSSFMYLKQRIAHNAGARLSGKLAEGYMRLPYAFHLHRSSSELIRNAHQTVEVLAGQCFLPAIQVVSESIVMLGILAILAVIAPSGTLIAIVVVGGAALLLLRVVQPRLKHLGATAQAGRMATLATLQQSLYGIRDIKLLAGEEHFGRAYRRQRKRLARALYIKGTVAELPRHVIETALIGFILTLFAFSIISGVGTEEIFATIGLFAYAGMRMMPSLQKIVSGMNNIRFAGAAVEQVHSDLLLVEQHESDPPATDALPLSHGIGVKDVHFTYAGCDQPALRDINVEIRRGEVVGICGPTGSGKTTLTDILTGILTPTIGSVTVDGYDIFRDPSRWYRSLGVVPQMVFLTDDTLRRNIALGVDDDDVDEEALNEAVELAQLDDFVRSLPDGLNAVVGERGVRISGGQRQRIAIARALYRRPEVLVFDEGTSALDNATEAVLMSSLERLRGKHTILLVAHRLSTVRNCDQIIYLESGEVTGIGTFDELQQRNEGFRTLARHG